MHANTQITDEIYSSLKEAEIKDKIRSLGVGKNYGESSQQVIEMLETLLENLKSGSSLKANTRDEGGILSACDYCYNEKMTK